MSRDTTRFSPEVGSLFSYVELDNLTVTPTSVTYTQKGGITSSYNWSFTGTCTLQWWENGTWHDAAGSKSATYSGYGDKVYDTIADSFTRQSADRLVSVGCLASATVNGRYSSARAYIDFTVPALPPNATTLTATRNSDTSVALSWAAGSGVKENVRIERSTDGGSYSEIATVSGTATSYTDSSTSADHAYSYRIRYYNKNAYGGYSATATVTMSPSAPSGISLERADATNVNVTLVNTSAVATSIEWQASYDGGTTWGASTTVNGSPVTSFTASTSGGTVLLRVRNVNSVGSSAWIVSEPIVTITPPAAPTLVSPVGVFNMSAGTVSFKWLHNPKDGSAQTAAQLAYSTNGGGSWTTVDLTAEQTYSITPIPWAAGTTVTWRVRTKGADPSYGDWASSKQFTCYQVPSLTFAANNPPATVTALPIPIQVTYSDPQGMACAAASVSVQKDGRTLYTEPLTINGNTLSGSITSAELLPANGESYAIVVNARSGSSLQTSANMVVTVDYVAPAKGTVEVQNDPETGYANLLAFYDNHASDVTYSGNTNSGIAVDGAAIRALTIDGKSVQNGTPSPSSPVPIQVVQGANLLQLVARNYSSSGCTAVIGTDSVEMNGTSISNLTVKLAPGDATVLPAGQYTIMCDVPNVGVSVQSSETNASPYTFTSDGTLTMDAMRFVFNANETYTNVIAHFAVYEGNVDYPYVPYGSLGIAVTSNGTTTVTPIPLSGNVLASLPDGTKDVLTVDSSGHAVITKNVNSVDIANLPWIKSGTAGHWYASSLNTAMPYKSKVNTSMLVECYAYDGTRNASPWYSTNDNTMRAYADGTETRELYVNDLAGYADVTAYKAAIAGNRIFYQPKTVTTVDLGYITMPELADGYTVEVLASLSTPLSMVSYDGLADAESISVIRVNKDDSRTQLADHAANYTAIVDKYAPLNTDYTYEVVTYAASGAYAVEVVPNLLETTRWFAYWGENNIAWAQWNPSGSYTLNRPEKKRVHYAGRKWPVSYDSKAMEQSHSMTWTVVDMDDWRNGFVDLMDDGGRGVYKGCDGWVFHADFEYSATPQYTSITRMGEVSLTITRIDGEQL